MCVEYDSTRVFFFLPPAAFLGALADFLEGVLAMVIASVFGFAEDADPRRRALVFPGRERASPRF